MKLISIGNNTLGYRIFVLLVGLSVIGLLNFFLFGYFMGYSYSIYLVVFWFFLAVILWYLIKYSKYVYKLDNRFLYVKTPRKEYKIPLSDIQRVGDIEIPLHYKIGQKYDNINKIAYLCGFSDKGIILDLKTHNIVISPRKFEEFKKNLIK